MTFLEQVGIITDAEDRLGGGEETQQERSYALFTKAHEERLKNNSLRRGREESPGNIPLRTGRHRWSRENIKPVTMLRNDKPA